MEKKDKQDNKELANLLAFAAATLYAMAGQYADLQGNRAKRMAEKWEKAGDWLAEKAKEMNQQQQKEQATNGN